MDKKILLQRIQELDDLIKNLSKKNTGDSYDLIIDLTAKKHQLEQKYKGMEVG